MVVDNGSQDKTSEVLRSFGDRVQWVRMARNLGAAARNLGVRRARTPLIAFCDDDGWWESDALSRAVSRFDGEPQLGLLNGRILVGREGRIDPACATMQAATALEDEAGKPISYFIAAAAIVRRCAFLEAGGYHERYHIGAEESLLSLDLASRGWKLRYCHEVVLYHHPSTMTRDAAARRHLVLRNRLWTAWLRHSASSAARLTALYSWRAARDPAVRAALRDALRGLPWIVRERKPISAELQRRIESLDTPIFE